MKITSKKLRNMWLDFYKSKGHKDIGAVSLIGDGTTGVMFNVAGMQPLMPYLLGAEHPMGKRLCNVQGCVRTIDIDSVGDSSHCTFFEMMGNWSIGDYFKKEKTAWTYELLTEKFGLDKNNIHATVFEGDDAVPRDNETASYLLELGIKKENIHFMGKDDNWWELAGTVGTPCGPDNEWFYPLNGELVEIGNDVYMQYKKLEGDKVELLENKNVDTGFGFERCLMFLNGVTDVYKTDLFESIIKHLEKVTGIQYGADEKSTRAMRIIADHTRTTVMLIGDKNGIVPSNVGAGYILRRIMRRAIRYTKQLGIDAEVITSLARIFIEEIYNEAYPLLVEKEQYIIEEIEKENKKFTKALETGMKEFDKLISGMNRKNEFMKKQNPEFVEEKQISGKSAFRLFDTFGFPLELTEEMAGELGFGVDAEGFKEAFKEHQEKSKSLQGGEFKSGLADDSEMTIKYHTATHLLNAALKRVIGEKSHQMGSNITAERLRFDFPCDHKMTEEELKAVEDLVNGWIRDEIEVTREEMNKMDAVKVGAEHQFIERYPDVVSVYTIGSASKEICTGPHVQNTKELGKFKITKEEASSSGVRRIKAILE